MKTRMVWVVVFFLSLPVMAGQANEEEQTLEKLRMLRQQQVDKQQAEEQTRMEERRRQQREMQEKQRAVLEKQHAEESDKFHVMQRQMQDLSGRTDVSADGLQKTAARLDDQLEALMLEEIGAKARSDALAASIAELNKKAQAQGDEVSGELEKVYGLKLKLVDRLRAMAENKAVALEEVDRANADAAEAKIKLLERRQNLIGGGDGLSGWNKELIELSVATHERRARLAALKEQLERIRNALARLPELQFQEEKMKSVRSKLVGASYRFGEVFGQ